MPSRNDLSLRFLGVAAPVASLLAALLAGCPGTSLAPLGGECSRPGRGSAAGCRAGLVCSFGRCRDDCDTARDCDGGRRCLASDGGNACSLETEDTCRDASDCPGGLECARGECRTACTDETECGEGGMCSSGSCTEPVSTAMPDGSPCTIDEDCRNGSVCAMGVCEPGCTVGCEDAGGPRSDARIVVEDVPIPRLDSGPRSPQSMLANAFTAHPDPAQVVTLLGAFVSPPFPARDIILGSMQAPIGVSLTARTDSDGRGVGYIGAVDGTGAARLYRFSPDAPEAATDRSSDLAAATNLIDIALLEDAATVRGLLLRDRSADMPATQAGWTWAEGSPPTPYDRTLGTGGHGVYTFGSAAISGGDRSIGPDQDLRYLVRERQRNALTTMPVTYEPGPAYLSALDTARRAASSDATAALFTGDVLVIRGLPDFALVWDPDTGLSAMMRLREEGAGLRTSFERLGFLDMTEAPPAIAQQHIARNEAMIALPNGPSTTIHQISCPEPSDCVSEAMVFLPTPGGTSATQLAAAPLRNGYALLTVDSEGIVLRVLGRDLTLIPGYDDGTPLEPLGTSTLRLDGSTYNLLDLEAYAVAIDDAAADIASVTLLVAGLYTNFTTRESRLWVTGLRVTVP